MYVPVTQATDTSDSVPASLTALAAFLVGALADGRLGSRTGKHRGRFLAIAILVKILLVGAALVIAAAVADPDSQLVQYAIIVQLAVAMGLPPFRPPPF